MPFPMSAHAPTAVIISPNMQQLPRLKGILDWAGFLSAAVPSFVTALFFIYPTIFRKKLR